MAKATSSGASRTGSKTVSRSATRTKAASGKATRTPATPARKPAVPERKPAVAERKPAAAVPVAAPVVEPKPAAAPACPKSSEITTINAAMRFLLARPDFERQRAVQYGEQTFKLDRMQRLLGNLGNPHQKVKTVHVAGTNGKGSTVTMIASMLRAGGYTVGLYTSPHLVDIRERVQIDGQPIGKNDFVEAVKRVAKAAEKLGEQPTFFEAITAVGFLHFAAEAVDVAVIEVGLGGRLDSTNVITPLVSIVTSIDLDHTKLLGATPAQIAREKAGIFKKGVPALFFEQ